MENLKYGKIFQTEDLKLLLYITLTFMCYHILQDITNYQDISTFSSFEIYSQKESKRIQEYSF